MSLWYTTDAQSRRPPAHRGPAALERAVRSLPLGQVMKILYGGATGRLRTRRSAGGGHILRGVDPWLISETRPC